MILFIQKFVSLELKTLIMKYILLVISSIFVFNVHSQISLNMNLSYQWKDFTIASSFAHDNTYNEIWGYAKNGREYAIIGTTLGTHIFDVTDINNVDTVDFIPGKVQGGQIVHRDYDTYQDHLYMVADEGASSLQIADLTFLPDSVSLVYDSDSLIVRSHNIFIDTTSGNLYTCGGATSLGANFLSVYSLAADPANPQFLINCENDVPFWGTSVRYVHDIYVKNDTAYCNSETRGLYVVDFTDMSNVQALGTYNNYPQQGYNHSGWLHPNGQYYAFADETHGTDVKIVDVSDFSNITLVDTIGSNIDLFSIPHNLIYSGDYLYVSFYFDGLYVFDTSDPNNISLAGFYDTSNRPHFNNVYQGNWGVYPFLPSGKVLVSDMQEGLFVLEPTFATGIDDANLNTDFSFIVYPNPTTDFLTVTTTKFERDVEYIITDISGRVVRDGKLYKSQTNINVNDLTTGIYVLSVIESGGDVVVKKFVKE